MRKANDDTEIEGDAELRAIAKSIENVRPCTDYNRDIGDVLLQYSVNLADLHKELGEKKVEPGGT